MDANQNTDKKTLSSKKSPFKKKVSRQLYAMKSESGSIDLLALQEKMESALSILMKQDNLSKQSDGSSNHSIGIIKANFTNFDIIKTLIIVDQKIKFIATFEKSFLAAPQKITIKPITREVFIYLPTKATGSLPADEAWQKDRALVQKAWQIYFKAQREKHDLYLSFSLDSNHLAWTSFSTQTSPHFFHGHIEFNQSDSEIMAKPQPSEDQVSSTDSLVRLFKDINFFSSKPILAGYLQLLAKKTQDIFFSSSSLSSSLPSSSSSLSSSSQSRPIAELKDRALHTLLRQFHTCQRVILDNQPPVPLEVLHLPPRTIGKNSCDTNPYTPRPFGLNCEIINHPIPPQGHRIVQLKDVRASILLSDWKMDSDMEREYDFVLKILKAVKAKIVIAQKGTLTLAHWQEAMGSGNLVHFIGHGISKGDSECLVLSDSQKIEHNTWDDIPHAARLFVSSSCRGFGEAFLAKYFHQGGEAAVYFAGKVPSPSLELAFRSFYWQLLNKKTTVSEVVTGVRRKLYQHEGPWHLLRYSGNANVSVE